MEERNLLELASWTAAMHPSALQDMLVATASPDVISLALGLPAPDLFPTAALGSVIERSLLRDPRALQYGPSSEGLREFVVGLMQRRGVSCTPEQVFLTTGAQQGMSLVARLVLDPSSLVVTESYSYTGFHQAIACRQPRVVTVPTHAETGMDLDALERLLAEGECPRLCYAMSDGHNPVGASLSLEKRRRLVGLAREHGFCILEDDAYGMISYGPDPLPALRGLEEDWVIYVGSFSKTLAPALRTGWVVVPERFLQSLASLKEGSDINTATLGQRAVAGFVESGGFDDHVNTLRQAYAERRDVLLDALAREFPEGSRWSRPEAGFFVWVELQDGIDSKRLFQLALERERVAFLPGQAFAPTEGDRPHSTLRLNFSYPRPDVIEEGIARIGRALRQLSGASAPSGRGA